MNLSPLTYQENPGFYAGYPIEDNTLSTASSILQPKLFRQLLEAEDIALHCLSFLSYKTCRPLRLVNKQFKILSERKILSSTTRTLQEICYNLLVRFEDKLPPDQKRLLSICKNFDPESVSSRSEAVEEILTLLRSRYGNFISLEELLAQQKEMGDPDLSSQIILLIQKMVDLCPNMPLSRLKEIELFILDQNMKFLVNNSENKEVVIEIETQRYITRDQDELANITGNCLGGCLSYIILYPVTWFLLCFILESIFPSFMKNVVIETKYELESLDYSPILSRENLSCLFSLAKKLLIFVFVSYLSQRSLRKIGNIASQKIRKVIKDKNNEKMEII